MVAASVTVTEGARAAVTEAAAMAAEETAEARLAAGSAAVRAGWVRAVSGLGWAALRQAIKAIAVEKS